MLSILFFPVAFIMLWAAPGVLTESLTSPNDPLRGLAIHVTRHPEPPICCLQPTPSRDSLEDGVLLSFDEWKRRQYQQEVRGQDDINRSAQTLDGPGSRSNFSANVSQSSTADAAALQDTLPDSGEGPPKSLPTEFMPPHFRVPLTDRFNYASSECSARVHLAHRSAKSASSILSSKRDRYMLSPCGSKEQHFVIVELCEDIMIDTVQLANFEFFSGVFKDFKVSVAKTYSTKPEDWTSAGVYRAKNVRGVQSVHPPRTLRDFYRYIRIDFLSYFGNEFYCPVSLLRVYGLTHLEQFKWDLWEAESRSRTAKDVAPQVVSPESSLDTLLRSSSESGYGTGISSTSLSPTSGSFNSMITIANRSITSIPFLVNSSSVGADLSPISIVTHPKPTEKTGFSSHNEHSPPTVMTTATTTVSGITNFPQSSPVPILTTTSSTSLLANLPSPLPAEGSESVTLHIPPAAVPLPSSSQQNASSLVSPSSPSVLPPSHTGIAPVITGGESIYRTIMNRLTALEGNHTLYARYIEQQNSAVREVLKRLAEDVGRLEGITRGHIQGYQRKTRELEQQQQELQMVYRDVMLRLEYLSNEILLEKRIGIAQLFLLLIVLVFMGLTRGSRGERVQINDSVNTWRKHLSLSGDWTKRFKSRGQNQSISHDAPIAGPPSRSAKIPASSDPPGSTMEFQLPQRGPLLPRDVNTDYGDPRNTHVLQSSFRSHLHTRTPSLRRHYQPKPVTPTSGHRPQTVRAISQLYIGALPLTKTFSGSGTGHRNIKRRGNAAHLHVVQKNHEDEGHYIPLALRENQMALASLVPRRAHRHRREESEDVFGPVPWHKAKVTVPDSPMPQKFSDETEGDQWVDTDAEGSEPGVDWDA